MAPVPRVPPIAGGLHNMSSRHTDPLARTSSHASSVAPTPSASSPRVPPTSRTAPLKLTRGDLVAYEYLYGSPTSPQWSWGLGTVAAVRGLRVVQLVPWHTHDVDDDNVTAAQLRSLQDDRVRLEHTAATLEAELAVHAVRDHAARTGLRTQLAAATETLRRARHVLQQVTAQEWRELRSYHSPPAVVTLVLSATMVALGETETRGWSGIQRVLRDPSFLRRVQQHDPTTLPAVVRRRLQSHYLNDPLFSYENAMKGSKALGALQQWVAASVQNNAAVVQLDERDRDAAARAGRAAKEQQLAEVNTQLQHCLAETEQLRVRALGADEANSTTARAPSPSVERASKTSARRRTPRGPSVAADTTHTTLGWQSALLQRHGTGGVQVAPLLVPTAAELVTRARQPWTLTGDDAAAVCTVLRSSILYNYSMPDTLELTLAPQQVEHVVRSVRERATGPAQDELAVGQRLRELEEEVCGLRGQCAMERLHAAETVTAPSTWHDAAGLCGTDQLAGMQPDVTDVAHGSVDVTTDTAAEVTAVQSGARDVRTDATTGSSLERAGQAAVPSVGVVPDVLRAVREQAVTLQAHAVRTGDVLQDLQRHIQANPRLCALMESV